MAISQISLIIQAFRPKTLSAAILPVTLGSYASYVLFAEMNPVVFVCALLGAIFIQIGTNLANDSADFVRGADGASRKGPQRLSQTGAMTPKKVMWMATGFFVAAALVGLPLIQIGGGALIAIGLISILMGYAYTSGPFPLAYHGLGDLFVVLFFGLVAVSTTVFLHAGVWAPEAYVIGLQVGLLSATLIMINNIRDAAEDEKVGKRTLAVKLGVNRAKWLLAFYFYLPYLFCTYWLIPHYSHAAVLPFFALFISMPLMGKIFETDPSPEYNQFLAKASLHSFVFSILFMLGLSIA